MVVTCSAQFLNYHDQILGGIFGLKGEGVLIIASRSKRHLVSSRKFILGMLLCILVAVVQQI